MYHGAYLMIMLLKTDPSTVATTTVPESNQAKGSWCTPVQGHQTDDPCQQAKQGTDVPK